MIYKQNPNKLSEVRLKDIVDCASKLPKDLKDYYLTQCRLLRNNPKVYKELYTFLYPGRKGNTSITMTEAILSVDFLQLQLQKYEEYVSTDPTNGLIFYSYIICKNRGSEWLNEENIFRLENHAIAFRAIAATLLKSIARINSYRHLFINNDLLNKFLDYLNLNIDDTRNFIRDNDFTLHQITILRFNFYSIAERFNIDIENIDILLNLDHTQGLLFVDYLNKLPDVRIDDKIFIKEKLEEIFKHKLL